MLLTDITNTNMTLILYAGETRRCFNLTIVDDDVLEETNTVTLRLLPVTSRVIAGNLSTTDVIINDDDSKYLCCIYINV